MAELQVTTSPTGINTNVSQRTSRFLNELTEISQGFKSSLQGLQEISRQNTQRELSRISTENRVEAEARNELQARLTIKKQEEAARKAAEREAKAIADAQKKQREKELKELRKQEQEKAVNSFLIDSMSGRDVSGLGNQINRFAQSGNTEAAQGLVSAAVSKARLEAERLVEADIANLDDTNAFDYDSGSSFTKYFSDSLAGLGVDESMLETYGSNEDLQKAVGSQGTSVEEHFNNLKERKKKFIDDAVNSIISVANYDALAEFDQGDNNALKKMLGNIEKAQFTYNRQLDRGSQGKAALDYLGTVKNYMQSDESLSKKAALSRFDELVNNANTSKASVLNRPEVRESIQVMRNQLSKAKDEKKSAFDITETISKTTVSNSNTSEEAALKTIDYVLARGGTPPVNGIYYTSSEINGMVDNGIITKEYAKSVTSKFISLNEKEVKRSSDTAKITEKMNLGLPIPRTINGREVTQDMKDEAQNDIILKYSRENENVSPVDQTIGLFRTTYRNESFTPEVEATFSINMSSPETLRDSYLLVNELREKGGDIFKYKLNQQTKDLYEKVDQFAKKNPEFFNNREYIEGWRTARDIILGGNEYVANNAKQEQIFKSSKAVKDIQSSVLDSIAYDADILSFKSNVKFSEVQNRDTINNLMDAASTEFFKTNRGSTEGYEDYLKNYMSSRVVVDPETKFAYEIDKNFSSADKQFEAYNATNFTKTILGDDINLYKNVDDFRLIPSSYHPNKLMIAYKDDVSNQWLPVTNKLGTIMTTGKDFAITNYIDYVVPKQ